MTNQGFATSQIATTIAFIVCLVLLIYLFVPNTSTGVVSGIQTQAQQNAKQIHLATFNMADNRITNKDSSVGWPGDLVASGTMQPKVTDFIKILVKGGYLQPQDLWVFAANGIARFSGTDVNQFSARPGPDNNCAFTIHCVQESDSGTAIFLNTINATFDVSSSTFKIDPNAKPFGAKGFIVFRKGGDGAIMPGRQASYPNQCGTPCKMTLTGTGTLRPE